MSTIISSRKEVYYLDEETKNLLKTYDERAKELKSGFVNHGHTDYQYYIELKNYNNFKNVISEDDFNKVVKQKRNRKDRRRRANKKLRPLLDSNNLVLFGTCTFDNSQFKKKNGEAIKERTRTKKVNEWIQRHFIPRLVNIS